MPTCFIYDNGNFPSDLRDRLEERLADWQLESVDRLEGLVGRLKDAEAPLVLYPSNLPSAERTDLTVFLRSARADASFVCAVDDGDVEAAERALREGASDYVFEEQLRSEHAAETLRASGGRYEIKQRERRLRSQLEERSTELLGLNALANGISSSLDRDTIVRRGLWVFAGICQQGAVALVELEQPMDPAEQPSTAWPPEDIVLECSASFSADSDEICGDIVFDDGWKEVLFDDRTVYLEERPAGQRFQGLEPFWDTADAEQARAVVVPLQANRRPVGALVLGRRGAEDVPEINLSREGLRAMGLQFASALENARLYADIKDAYETLQKAQEQLVYAEKFAAVGVLSAEIAHEINNPASFVISNLSVMLEYGETIADFIDELDERIDASEAPLADEFEQLKRRHDIAYLREDMNSLLSRSLAGMQRIHQIVQDLRYLSRDSGEEPGWVELESLLEATINLVGHEAKFRADIERDYGDVPQVMSDASRLSQVFLNLLVNAVQSIDTGDVEDNAVRISTRRRGDAVEVAIEDTGRGIPEDLRARIFEPFFTTKEIGDGTGLGLSISRDIIRSLGGSIELDSTVGEGSTFRVRIPIRAEKFGEDENLRDSGYYDTPPGVGQIRDDRFED